MNSNSQLSSYLQTYSEYLNLGNNDATIGVQIRLESYWDSFAKEMKKLKIFEILV